jgi:hypothetical protein
VNGVLGYVVLIAVLVGGSQVIGSKAFDYAGMGVFAAWQIWALVGILRCVLRLFREPHSVVQRVLAGLVVIVLAIVIYDIVNDLQMLVRLTTA